MDRGGSKKPSSPRPWRSNSDRIALCPASVSANGGPYEYCSWSLTNLSSAFRRSTGPWPKRRPQPWGTGATSGAWRAKERQADAKLQPGTIEATLGPNRGRWRVCCGVLHWGRASLTIVRSLFCGDSREGSPATRHFWLRLFARWQALKSQNIGSWAKARSLL